MAWEVAEQALNNLAASVLATTLMAPRAAPEAIALASAMTA